MKTTKELIESVMHEFKYDNDGEISKLGACNIMMAFMADYIGYNNFRLLLAANSIYFENEEAVDESITDMDRLVCRVRDDEDDAVEFCLDVFTTILEGSGDNSAIELGRMLEAAKREAIYN